MGDAPRRRPRPEEREPQHDERPRPARRPHTDAPPVAHPSGLNHFFAPCTKGLEQELVAELTEIGVEDARPAPGGVAFRGNLELAWRVNLWSRLAVRVLWRVGEGRYRSEDDLYQGAAKVDWPNLFEVERTIAINTVGRNSPLKSLNFATLKIKDAICDRFRTVTGARPSVDTREPDAPVVLYLTDERYTLYVDLTGEPLNRRGFRVEPATAPLNENLAAGLIRLSGWQPGTPFFDPMMGGGTLLIEAAMMWLNRAPGLRRHFAFEKLKGFDNLTWQRVRKEAEAQAHEPEALPIFGADVDPRMVRAAGLNLKAAGLLECVRLREADFLEVETPPGPGVLISNPPYGVRLSVDDMAALYQGMGDVLKQRYAGWTAWFITADEAFEKGIGLSASRRTKLYNGPLECRYYQYRMVSGSNREWAK
ncbi:MAG: class I SAM-dependent RNA methyltransferase [Betaproteobacteria bacterium]|nr:class I SAM-dependent RNA methyltransferase [Betaproteobacteria bacterium]